jgi:hypothetical protein
LKFAFTGKAMSYDDASTAITPTYETSKVFDWTDIVSITIGGTDVKCAIQEMTLEFNNNLQNFHGLCGDVDPSTLYVEPSEITGSISAYMTTDMKTLKSAFMDKTNKEIIITLAGDETIGNGSNNRLVITLPKVQLNTYANAIDTSYVAVESDLVCATGASGKQITVELTNLVASY